MSGGIRIGIDIGGTSTRGIAIDAHDRVLHELSVFTRTGPAAILSTTSELVDELRGAVDEPLLGVGIGVPGMVDWPEGVVTHAVNIGVERLDLGRELSARVDAPVWVDNDVNVAALGAAQLHPGWRSLGFLNIGTGLAAGIVIDGVLWRGSRGVVGEIGHIAVEPAAGTCPCGQVGCLELLASGSALARSLPPGVSPAALDAELLRDSDTVRAAFSGWVDAVALAAKMLMLSVGVERVVIGGGAAALGPLLGDAVIGTFDRWSERSPFIAGLGMQDRTFVGVPDRTATLGAALLVQPAREFAVPPG